jgi:hypothetical protein
VVPVPSPTVIPSAARPAAASAAARFSRSTFIVGEHSVARPRIMRIREGGRR